MSSSQSSSQQAPLWGTMTPGQFGITTGTQGGLFAVDSQGRPGGDLFADAE